MGLGLRRWLRSLLLAVPFALASAVDQPLTIALPPQSELSKLAELTAQFAGVSLQYNPQKLQGTVKLSVRGELSPAELWDVFNQVLVSQGFTTVVTGLPPVYQVVALTEAATFSAGLTPRQQAQLKFQPGYSVVIHDLAHLSPEVAVKAVGALFTGQNSQIRTLGPDSHRVVIAGVAASIKAAEAVLVLVDRADIQVEAHLFKPQRAVVTALQGAATAAWAGINRIGAQNRQVEIQVAPDGVQLLLIASQEDAPALQKLVDDLDRAEPVETRTYRPRFFAIDEVANLLKEVLRSERAGPQAELPIIRDKLTNSLIIKATAAEHQRIADLVKRLDEAPEGSRRQLRTFVVKNRQVEELAAVLSGLVSGGVVNAASSPGEAPRSTTPTATNTAATPVNPAPGAAPNPPTTQQPTPVATPAVAGLTPNTGAELPSSAPRAAPTTISAGGGDSGLLLTTDPATNRIIAFGDSRQLDQVAELIKRLDLRQPQVEIEVIMVTLSDSENLDLGTELVGSRTRGETTTTLSSLFGLSNPVGGDPTTRALAAGAGFGGLVINPGDYAVVVHALEVVNKGKSLIRTKVVVSNNAKATVNGVVQQPVSSINASNTVSTTSFGGTSDAGTQLTLSPQISAADHVTLTYNVTESAFIGSGTTTADGAAIPPPKRSDSVASVATIPDGYVIALGGLSTTSKTNSESRVPLLGRIPGLGLLFKTKSDADSDSRFYIFIRATVLRQDNFQDLRHLSDRQAVAADLHSEGWPQLEPKLIR